jgi:hypothetical protein
MLDVVVVKESMAHAGHKLVWYLTDGLYIILTCSRNCTNNLYIGMDEYFRNKLGILSGLYRDGASLTKRNVPAN